MQRTGKGTRGLQKIRPAGTAGPCWPSSARRRTGAVPWVSSARVRHDLASHRGVHESPSRGYKVEPETRGAPRGGKATLQTHSPRRGEAILDTCCGPGCSDGERSPRAKVRHSTLWDRLTQGIPQPPPRSAPPTHTPPLPPRPFQRNSLPELESRQLMCEVVSFRVLEQVVLGKLC